jgi:hypothetical protein
MLMTMYDYGDSGWLSDCLRIRAGLSDSSPVPAASLGWLRWLGRRCAQTDCSPVVRAGEGGQGDDLLDNIIYMRMSASWSELFGAGSCPGTPPTTGCPKRPSVVAAS